MPNPRNVPLLSVFLKNNPVEALADFTCAQLQFVFIIKEKGVVVWEGNEMPKKVIRRGISLFAVAMMSAGMVVLVVCVCEMG